MTALPLADRETAVYRLFDAADKLLYVGCSWDPDKRIGTDHLFKPWGRDIDDVTFEWFDNRLTALRAEAQAITDESPVYNKLRPCPEAISGPKPTPEPPVRESGLNFEQAAEELDVPIDWLWRDVALGKVPHSCIDPKGDDVWFTPEDIRDLHVLFNWPDLGGKRREWERARIRRTARYKRCEHYTAF